MNLNLWRILGSNLDYQRPERLKFYMRDAGDEKKVKP